MTYHVTTEKRFHDMLGALPPTAYHAGGFLVGEPVSARICTVTGQGAATYEAFFEVDDIHLQTSEPMTVREFMQIEEGTVRLSSQSICQHCQFRENRDMITTYSLKHLVCDLCGRVGDLALVLTTPRPAVYNL